MEFITTQDRLVVELVKEELKSRGGIFLLEKEVEQPLVGRILAVGPGRVTKKKALVPVKLAVGDIIWFNKKESEQMQMEGKKYFIVKERNVLLLEDQVA